MNTIEMTIKVTTETAWKIIDLLSAEEAVSAHAATPTPAAPAPVPTPQYAAPAPVPAPAPIPQTAVPAPVPVAAAAPSPAPVPTAVPAYTIAQLQTACAPLADAGKLAELQKLIASFGVSSLAELSPARYGEFANGLRALGGVL